MLTSDEAKHGKTAATARFYLAGRQARDSAAAEPSAQGSARWRHPIIGLIAVIGVVSSVVLYLTIASWQSHLARIRFDEEAAHEALFINSQIAGATNVLYMLQAYFEVPGQTVSRSGFRAFSRALRKRAVGLRDTGWAPSVTKAERPAFGAAVRADGFPDFQIKQKGQQGNLVPAGNNADYYPILFSDPATANLPVLGFDLISEKLRRDAVRRALETGAPAATPPLQLANAQRRRRNGFMAFLPVYRSHVRGAARATKVLGVVLAAFQTTDMMDHILDAQSRPVHLNIYLLGPKGTDEGHIIYRHTARRASGPAPPLSERSLSRGPHWAGTVRVVDQKIRAIITPNHTLGEGPLDWHALAALVGGLSGTTIVIWYLLVSASYAERLEALTVRLHAKTEELRHNVTAATFLATHDALTGLPNRKLLFDRLDQALATAPRIGKRVAMLCMGLDHFKEVNDAFGHSTGDAMLRIVASRLAACLREGDTLARLGDDEFAVVQPHCNSEHDAEVLAGRLLEAISLPIDLDGDTVNVGASIGIDLSGDNYTSSRLLKDAGMALYQAKEYGGNIWCFFAPEMHARMMERRQLEVGLRTAVAEQQFCLHYQPLVDLRTRSVIGAEALLRWNRPGHGLMSPNSFIGVAEEIGLITSIGRWALQEACRTAAGWPGHLTIAVNVSPLQFRMSGFFDVIDDALAASGLDPSRLEIEITEGMLLNDTDETLTTLAHLRRMSVRLVMDDFGTGYSSLGYLQKFQFDKIKIDRSFVERLAKDPNASAIVRAVMALGNATGVSTLAEGVETEDEAKALIREGCREAQGYLYGKPMPPETFAEVVLGLSVRPSPKLLSSAWASDTAND